MNVAEYITGLRKGTNARRMEIDAMRDPFLAEALEGYDSVKGDHAGAVAALQRQVSRRTKYRRIPLWAVSACSAAAVGLFVFYLLMPSPVRTDSEGLFVYLPENYVKQNYQPNPDVEIENEDMLTPEVIEIYVPDSYLEKKQQSAYEAEMPVSDAVPTIDILNLDEFFAPEEPIDIYLPDGYRQNVPSGVNVRQID
jgi:hypothetical protein